VKWLLLVSALATAVAVAIVVFSVRELRPHAPPAAVGQPDDGATAAPRPVEEAPPFDGVVNGIRIFPSSPDKSDFRIAACETAPAVEVPPSTAYGTELDFTFPAGWQVVGEMATSCGDTLVVFGRDVNSPLAGLQVTRTRADPSVGITAPQGQVRPVTINGKPAALIEPRELQPGYFSGPAMVIIRETFGLTMIRIWNPDMAPHALDLASQIK